MIRGKVRYWGSDHILRKKMKSRIKWLMPEMQDKAVQKQPKGEGKKGHTNSSSPFQAVAP
jgi:hypothetical protein